MAHGTWSMQRRHGSPALTSTRFNKEPQRKPGVQVEGKQGSKSREWMWTVEVEGMDEGKGQWNWWEGRNHWGRGRKGGGKGKEEKNAHRENEWAHSIQAFSDRVVGFTTLGRQLLQDSTQEIARSEPREHRTSAKDDRAKLVGFVWWLVTIGVLGNIICSAMMACMLSQMGLTRWTTCGAKGREARRKAGDMKLYSEFIYQ
ncbi:hypothetical protein B0H13DRAFT_1861485 [Mycena leptocephala]|nr:hypothetical protein B0H13DRAFT_1861485 [Mycena leptocephala]